MASKKGRASISFQLTTGADREGWHPLDGPEGNIEELVSIEVYPKRRRACRPTPVLHSIEKIELWVRAAIVFLSVSRGTDPMNGTFVD